MAYLSSLVIVLLWWPLGWVAKGWPLVILLTGSVLLSIARGVANEDDWNDRG